MKFVIQIPLYNLSVCLFLIFYSTCICVMSQESKLCLLSRVGTGDEGLIQKSRPYFEIFGWSVLGNIVIMRGSTEGGSGGGGGVETQQNSNVFKYIIKLPKKMPRRQLLANSNITVGTPPPPSRTNFWIAHVHVLLHINVY